MLDTVVLQVPVPSSKTFSQRLNDAMQAEKMAQSTTHNINTVHVDMQQDGEPTLVIIPHRPLTTTRKQLSDYVRLHIEQVRSAGNNKAVLEWTAGSQVHNRMICFVRKMEGLAKPAAGARIMIRDTRNGEPLFYIANMYYGKISSMLYRLDQQQVHQLQQRTIDNESTMDAIQLMFFNGHTVPFVGIECARERTNDNANQYSVEIALGQATNDAQRSHTLKRAINSKLSLFSKDTAYEKLGLCFMVNNRSTLFGQDTNEFAMISEVTRNLVDTARTSPQLFNQDQQEQLKTLNLENWVPIVGIRISGKRNGPTLMELACCNKRARAITKGMLEIMLRVQEGNSFQIVYSEERVNEERGKEDKQ
jgi:hypothetical protein